MTVTQTIDVPADRRVTLPSEVPVGRNILTFTPAPKEPHPCPICAKNINPETGNPRYNAETVAAIEEGQAIMRGEIEVEWHKSHELRKELAEILSEADND